MNTLGKVRLFWIIFFSTLTFISYVIFYRWLHIHQILPIGIGLFFLFISIRYRIALGFVSFRKIHSDHGVYYSRIKKFSMIIYDIDFITMRAIDSVTLLDNMDKFKQTVIEMVERDYENKEAQRQKDLAEMNRTDRERKLMKQRANKYKQWDGYLSKQAARDAKIDDVI